MANRRLRKRLKARGSFFEACERPVPFRPGQLVRLPEKIFFTPPGIYRFEGVSGPLAHFRIGAHAFTIHMDFLSHFSACPEDQKVPDAEDEARYVREAEAIIQSLRAQHVEEDELSPGPGSSAPTVFELFTFPRLHR